MAGNLFDSIDGVVAGGSDAAAPWAARSPFRPEGERDLMLVPRVRDWGTDPAPPDPAAAALRETKGGVDVVLDDEWVEARGTALEEGADPPDANADLAAGARYAVYF